MVSKSNLRHHMADHKSWSPAIHFQELGEVENVKHTFELKLSSDTTDAQKNEIAEHLGKIVEEYDLGYDYHVFFYNHGHGKNKETYLVIATKDARFVNGITAIYEKKPETRQENRFYDIGDFQDKILRPEIASAGATYVFTEAGSVNKEQREISDSPVFFGYKSSTVDRIPRNIGLFATTDFEGIER